MSHSHSPLGSRDGWEGQGSPIYSHHKPDVVHELPGEPPKVAKVGSPKVEPPKVAKVESPKVEPPKVAKVGPRGEDL
jgi:hypothetical protein